MADVKRQELQNTTLRIDEPEKVYPTLKALASIERLEILNLLGRRSMNVHELADALRLPLSSAAMHVQLLEEAGLISCEIRSGVRGKVKLCSGCVRALQVILSPKGDSFHSANHVAKYELPLGAFSTTDGIRATCGIGSTEGLIGKYDRPGDFYHPDRLNAQVMWLREGFVEYRFPMPEEADVQWLEFSFEGNPQTASYHAPWKSDISVYINGVRLGVWHSVAERSVRRGFHTPQWWNTVNTQYGELKTWRVTSKGSYLDSDRISDVTLSNLKLYQQDTVVVRLGIDSDAADIGGLVLFGEQFGDFEQALVLRIGYNSDAAI